MSHLNDGSAGPAPQPIAAQPVDAPSPMPLPDVLQGELEPPATAEQLFASPRRTVPPLQLGASPSVSQLDAPDQTAAVDDISMGSVVVDQEVEGRTVPEPEIAIGLPVAVITGELVTGQPALPVARSVLEAPRPRAPMSRDARYGRQPIPVVCEQCNHEIVTQPDVGSACSAAAVAASSTICLFGLVTCLWPCTWLGCQLLPFCVPELRDTVHHCPNCGAQCGRHRVLQGDSVCEH